MEVILLQDIDTLGYKSDIVKVRDGYARNYLLPQKLAIIANESNKKQNAENGSARNAHARPYSVRRAERQLLERKSEKYGACYVARHCDDRGQKHSEAVRLFHSDRPGDFKYARYEKINPFHLFASQKISHLLTCKDLTAKR